VDNSAAFDAGVRMPKKGERDPIKERYWRKVLADWRASGMFAKEYCIKHNVHYNNFVNWRKRIPERDAEFANEQESLDTVCFAPVRVSNSEAATDRVACEISLIAMEVALPNGIVLRLSSTCPMKLVSDVVSLLGVN
jgi:hypothetical protein